MGLEDLVLSRFIQTAIPPIILFPIGLYCRILNTMYIKLCIFSTIDSLNYSINGIIKSRQNIFIKIATFALPPPMLQLIKYTSILRAAAYFCLLFIPFFFL